MGKQLYWLSDAEWEKVEALLPRGRRGAHRVDDRRVISGIIPMLRSGARWRDCPPEYGPTRQFTTALTAGAAKAFGSRCSSLLPAAQGL
jgi:transposase